LLRHAKICCDALAETFQEDKEPEKLRDKDFNHVRFGSAVAC
jgi:hypothetical protein